MLRIFAIAVVLSVLGACGGRSGSPAAPPASPDAPVATPPAEPPGTGTPPAPPPAGRNLFVDGGFESGDPTFAPWMISIHADADAYTFDLDSQVMREGRHSLRVQRVRDEPYAGIVQPFRKRDLGGTTRFRLSGWLKGENVTHPVYLHAGFFAYGGVIGETDSAQRLQGSFDWTQLSLDIELPDHADRLEAGVTIGDGTVWVDGMELVPLPD